MDDGTDTTDVSAEVPTAGPPATNELETTSDESEEPAIRPNKKKKYKVYSLRLITCRWRDDQVISRSPECKPNNVSDE